MNNYYLILKGKPKGPYSLERMRGMWANKSIAPMAALVLTLQLGDYLGIQGASHYSYNINMSSSRASFLHDFSFTNIFLLLGVGLLACGASTAREAASRNSTNIKS
jgi:hypothetical protein